MGGEEREGSASSAQTDAALLPLPAKKRKVRDEELRRVAEIVMVLSAMEEMRAGNEPTAVERALAAEARERLARACEEVRPKDLFSSEAVRVVVEDLGLNRSRDPVLAFRPPKMSISERVQHTKKKMEESRDYTTSDHASQPHSMTFGPSSESHASQRLIAGKLSPMVLAAGSFPSNSTSINIPVLSSSMSPMKQTPTSEAQIALVKSSLGKDSHLIAMSSVEAVNQRLDARINGTPYVTLIQPTAVANYLKEKPSASGTSTQSQATNSQVNHEVKSIQASHQMMKTQDTKGPMVQATQVNVAIGNQPSQGLTFVHAPSFISNHNEIAKSIMSVVQPKVPDLPNLPPPSTQYMTKPLNCQVCKIIITDVESLLVCDACEKGIHLKCLQFHGTKAIPKAEWHCPKCLSTSNGKPFPPKYGRITRNIPAVTVTSSGGGTTLVEKNGEIPQAKFNHHKSMENVNLNSSAVAKSSNLDSSHERSAGESKVTNKKVIEVSSSNGKSPGEGIYSRTAVNLLDEEASLASATPGGQIGNFEDQTARIELSETEAPKPISHSQRRSFDKQTEQSWLSTSEIQQSVSESKPDIKTQSDLCSNPIPGTVDEISCQSHLPSGLQVIKEAQVLINAESTNNLIQRISKPITDDSKDISKSLEASSSQMLEARLEGEHGSQINYDPILGNGSDTTYCGNSSIEGLHKLNWVGDILEVEENRTYYKSCSINDFIFKLQDNVIVSTDNQNFYPAKLLSLFEDNKVRSKLAIVNEYFLPGNLLEGVSRPSTPVKDEVYASYRRNTVLASSICGLCDVLPEDKFREETDRKTLLEDKADVLHSVFVCKWMFDESKGIFHSAAQFV